MRSVIVSPRARRHLDRASQWWLSHRDKAPLAFNEEVDAGFATIAESPLIYPLVNVTRGIHRILLERVRYYIYYRVNADDDIVVLAVWHASRRPPRL